MWLASSKDVMGSRANSATTKVFAGIGLALLLAMAANTAFVTLPNKVKQYREKSAVMNFVPGQGKPLSPRITE